MIDWELHEKDLADTEMSDPDSGHLFDLVFGSGGSDVTRRIAEHADTLDVDPWYLLGSVLVGTLAACPPGIPGPAIEGAPSSLDLVFVSRMRPGTGQRLHPYRMAFLSVGSAPPTIFTGLAQMVAYTAYQQGSPGIIINVCDVAGLMAEPMAPGYVKGTMTPPILLPGSPAGTGRSVIVGTADRDVSDMPERRRRALSQSVWMRGRRPTSALTSMRERFAPFIPQLVYGMKDTFTLTATPETESMIVAEQRHPGRIDDVNISTQHRADTSTRIGVASLHALMCQRTTIIETDWQWAAGVVEHSRRVRSEAGAPPLTIREAKGGPRCSE